ncbi:uncharacterized protein LOC143301721 isoform X2 [Babylonia areolata]|uniref:uncharacterized protein LOC143301721 isoform X2 n=1 Tax=Babylonia areolata TaxID=304850 RepID=UPI003FCEFCA5
MEGGPVNYLRPFASQRGGRLGDRNRRGGNRPDRDPKDQSDRNGDLNNTSFDGKRMRKAIHRKTIDYNSSMIHYLENRVFQRDHRDRRAIQPDGLYTPQLMPPLAMQDKPMNCVTTKFVRTSTNKFRCPVFCLAWTPEGRRLVTGASSGEFTLWNGLTFNFETILQAHDVSVRAMRWTHNDLWMVTADHGGYVKYWQSNMNNVKMYQGHKEPIRGVSFCPTDTKFATCSDDGTVRVWDFLHCHEERILRGHGADVKCVDWHPQKSLVASGSKDNQQPVKLWDPRTGTSLATLHAHKHTVMDLRWNRNGQWLLTASRDHLLKVFDIRNMKTDMQTFKGHKKEATSLAWHPLHESLFTSGGSDGSLMFWIVGCDREVGSIEEAHEGMVWGLDWHPLGHILVSGSNDHTTKFWTRNRPGDEMRDRYNLNNLPTGVEQEILEYSKEDVQAMPSLPGMGLEHGLPDHLKPKEEEGEEVPSIPGLDWNQDSPFFKQMAAEKLPMKKIPFARPIPRNFEKAWLGHETPQSAMEKAASKPGILGMPPNLNPTMALNLLLQGNTASIPQEIVVNMMTEMQKQPQLMALGQQLLMKHQQDLMQSKQGSNPAPGQQTPKLTTGPPGMPPPTPSQQQSAGQSNNALQQQQQQQQQSNPMQQQQQQQPRPALPSRPALLQTPPQGIGGVRPMGPDGPSHFQPPTPGQPQFRPQDSSGGLADQKQFGPGGPGLFPTPTRPPFSGQPNNSLMPPPKENYRPVPGQSMGQQGMGDQDHRRPFPSMPPASSSSAPSSSLHPQDMDLRRPPTLPSSSSSTALDDFPGEGDQDFRHSSGPSMGGFPPKPPPQQSQDPFEDSDMRGQTSFYGQEGGGGGRGSGGGGYDDDDYGEQYGDFDLRMAPGGGGGGGDVDERFLQPPPPRGAGDMARGGHYDMHSAGYHGGGGGGGYPDNYGAPHSFGSPYDDDERSHGGRKRSWQDGPGRGRGGGQDSRRGGRGGGVRVYNGPAGPLDHPPRRGGRGRGGRGGW